MKVKFSKEINWVEESEKDNIKQIDTLIKLLEKLKGDEEFIMTNYEIDGFDGR